MNESALAKLKSDFPVLSNSSLIYLDSAASAQKPKVVLNAMDSFYRQKYAPVHRGLYSLGINATKDFEAARLSVARFINAEVGEIIITRGTTDSLNCLSRGILPVLGSHKKKILLTEMEHHSNIVPWQQFAKQNGFVIDYIPITTKYDFDLSVVKNLISNGDVALICMTHVSNVLGTINPIREVCELARIAGIITVIDGAQAIAHLPVDVKRLGCDFYTFSGHKLYGPTGVGVLYGRALLLEKVSPFTFGGHMIEYVTKHDATWAAIPQRFEAGTPPIAEVIGLSSAINYLCEIGLDDIHVHEAELARYAISKLKSLEGVTVFAGELNSGIVSFVIAGIHAHDIASLLSDRGICVRAGHHCTMPLTQVLGVPATVRASFGIYNSVLDVDALVAGVAAVVKLFRGAK